MDLLILMWRTPGCRVPNDDRWLAHHLGYTVDQIVHLVRPIISEFGTLVAGGDFVAQKRLQREFVGAHARKEKAAEANRARWNSRKRNGASAATNDQAKKKTTDGVIHSSPAPAPAPAHSTVQEQVAGTEGPGSLASARHEGALASQGKPPPRLNGDKGVDYRSPPRTKSNNVLEPTLIVAAKRSTSEE